MEQKLELKDIAGYLDYDLNLFNKRTGIIGQYQHPYLAISNDIVKNNRITLIPVLYPINAIYKPMVHNGKEIIPIVELAKIAFPNINPTGWYLGKNEARFTTPTGYIEFWFAFTDNSFIANRYEPKNQYQLFDYMHELKIDYRGLIDKGFAIDVNTLIENPYL